MQSRLDALLLAPWTVGLFAAHHVDRATLTRRPPRHPGTLGRPGRRRAQCVAAGAQRGLPSHVARRDGLHRPADLRPALARLARRRRRVGRRRPPQRAPRRPRPVRPRVRRPRRRAARRRAPRQQRPDPRRVPRVGRPPVLPALVGRAHRPRPRPRRPTPGVVVGARHRPGHAAPRHHPRRHRDLPPHGAPRAVAAVPGRRVGPRRAAPPRPAPLGAGRPAARELAVARRRHPTLREAGAVGRDPGRPASACRRGRIVTTLTADDAPADFRGNGDSTGRGDPAPVAPRRRRARRHRPRPPRPVGPHRRPHLLRPHPRLLRHAPARRRATGAARRCCDRPRPGGRRPRQRRPPRRPRRPDRPLHLGRRPLPRHLRPLRDRDPHRVDLRSPALRHDVREPVQSKPDGGGVPAGGAAGEGAGDGLVRRSPIDRGAPRPSHRRSAGPERGPRGRHRRAGSRAPRSPAEARSRLSRMARYGAGSPPRRSPA
jgi:hypothetical protein